MLLAIVVAYETQRIGRLTSFYSSSFTPFAARTTQYVKEQLGQAEDKVRNASWNLGSYGGGWSAHCADRRLQTQLPPDYIELEKRVDALKQVHQKMLQVTYVGP